MKIPTVDEVNAFLVETYPAAADDGLGCEELSDRSAVARWKFNESSLRPGGYISGPTQFAAADIALWFAAFTVIGLEAMAVTSEMSIRFLRPARNGDLLARATVHSVSDRRIVGSVELWIDGQQDKPVAVAQGTYARPSVRHS
ncbi:MAG: PaaI family thioesterase [Actinomycetota bacterium]|nr:PaaI family thioesterase [Actinomycetota bacterium]MDK1292553.1 PaaI family thioesterase [Actinomycetota bacterium]